MVNWDLFILHQKSDSIVGLIELLKHYGKISMPFHYLFLEDFKAVLFYDYQEIRPLSFFNIQMFKKSKEGKQITENETKGISQAMYFFTILDKLYKTYTYLRIDKTNKLSKFDLNTMSSLSAIEVYKELYKALITPGIIAKLVSTGCITKAQISAIYVDLITYVCRKMNDDCSSLKNDANFVTIITEYTVTFTITITTITRLVVFEEIQKKMKQNQNFELFKTNLKAIEFIVIPPGCQSFPENDKKCTSVITIYGQFKTLLIGSLRFDAETIDLLMDYLFDFSNPNLGKEVTQEVIYHYFFYFFKTNYISIQKEKRFDETKFWGVFLEKVKVQMSQVKKDETKNVMLSFFESFF
jgi:hypothetical protein